MYPRETDKYIAIDLKSFYASVECVERGLDPLTTNLVVADPTRTEKTICLAVSPSLKAYGIPGRARLFEVYAKLREVEKTRNEKVDFIIASPQMAKYMEISAKIYSIYLKYISSDDIHVYSIDEVFMDVTHYLSLYKMTAHELAIKMVREVLAETGITATAGIGTNLYLCKIAMDIVAKHMSADSDGVRIAELDEQAYRELLWDHLPITDFWRTGAGTARRLKGLGLYTMGDIARMSIKNKALLYKTFGIDAEILIDHAWGYEPCTMKEIKNYVPSTNSLSTGQVLKCPYSHQKARLIVQEMTELLVLDLVDKKLMTDSLTLVIGYDRENVDKGTYCGEIVTDHYGRSVPKSAHGTASLDSTTSSTMKIMDAVLKLYDGITDPALSVRRINLTANRVVPDSFEQLSLFDDPKALEKEKKLQQASLEIKKRFGKNAVLKGMNLFDGATTIERNGQIGGHKA